MSKHPIQPLEKDAHGVIRFKPNKIIQHLQSTGVIDLNKIAMMEFPQEDREQLAQLIGYSLSGFGSLSYASDETFAAADAMSKRKNATEEEARIGALEAMLEQARRGIKEAATAVFRVHPDDLHT